VAARSNQPPSFKKFDLSGAPWGVATEMACAEARRHLAEQGMMPFNFSRGVDRVKVRLPQRDAPRAVIVRPGDYHAFPNVIGCTERATLFCDYAYQRKVDGRLFVLETEGHDEADCVVNKFSFATTPRKPTSTLKPQDVIVDSKHLVDLPSPRND